MFKTCLSIALLALLTACANDPFKRSSQFEKPDDGAVVVRTAYVFDDVYGKHGSMVVRNMNENALGYYQIDFSNEASSNSLVFVGTLPAGHYRIDHFANAMESKILNEQFGEFDIKPRQMTDLGLLSFSLERGMDNELHRYIQHSHTGNNREIASSTVPEMVTQLHGQTLSWDPLHPPLGRDEDPHMLLAGVYSPAFASDGSFIYGTRFGNVSHVTTNGERVQAYLGEHVSLDNTLITAKGHWLAGGEFSTLMQSDDNGLSWHSQRGNLPFGQIFGLFQWHDRIIVTLRQNLDVMVFSAGEGSDHWQQLARYTLHYSLLGPKGVGPASGMFGDQLLVALPADDLAVLDLKTGATAMRKYPGDIFVAAFGGDGVARCKCVATIAMQTFESRDLGQTWQSPDGTHFLALPIMRDALHGLTFRGGPFFAKFSVFRTEDGGKTWLEGQAFDDPLAQMFYAPTGTTVYAVSNQGAFWKSIDDGKVWFPVGVH